jgi:hypothetical protein
MFIGHFGVAYFVKKKQPDIPLWLLFISVFLLDFIGSIFFLCRIESATLTPTAETNPFLQIKSVIPYSHSLTSAIIISIICFIIFWIIKKRNWAWILPLCIMSHWLLDLIIHLPDLSIFFHSSYKLGFGLYRHLYLTYFLEIILLSSGWLFLDKKNIYSFITILVMIALFSITVFAKQPEFYRTHFFTLTSILVFFAGVLYVFLAWLWEKRNKKYELIELLK